MPLLAAPPPSATLATNERVQARLAAGSRCCIWPSARRASRSCPSVAERLGCGGGREQLRAGRGLLRGAQGGGRLLRAARTGHRSRAGPAGPRQQGAALRAARVLPGDVVLPRPSWVSYAAQAALVGKHVIDVADRRRTRAGCRTPRRCARRWRRAGQAPRAGDPRPHAARQPDRHGGAGVADGGGLRGRRGARAADRVRRDLPRPRLRAPRRCAARRRCSPSASSSPTA